MLHKVLASASKEIRQLMRDPEGLGILFLMPVVFVAIMSLALQDLYRHDAAPQFELIILDGDGGALARDITQQIGTLRQFRAELRHTDSFDLEQSRLQDAIRRGRHKLGLLLPPGMSQRYEKALTSGDPRQIMNAEPGRRITLELLTDPALRSEYRAFGVAAIRSVVFAIEVGRLYTRYSGFALDAGKGGGLLNVTDESQTGPSSRLTPTSTQHNVPAYTLLAMFLLVIPLSGAFIKEREQGCLTRLRAMPVPGAVIIAGKLLPYLVINLLQIALCLGVGRFVLPLLGGEALQFGRSAAAGILIVGLCASFAAIGFGLLVAMIARTQEQASAFGATAVLLFAALGGVMVPKFIMPAALQSVAAWSPLGWALDGFLDLFVRDASVLDILPRSGALFAFGAICLTLSIWRFMRLSRLI